MKTQNIFLILIAACIAWFAVEFFRFRSETIGVYIPPEIPYYNTSEEADPEPEDPRPDIQLNNDAASRILERLEDYSRRQMVGAMLEEADLLALEELISLYIVVSEELGMTSDNEIKKQIELFVDLGSNLERLDTWADTATLAVENGASADEIFVYDIIAAYETLKIAFPTHEFPDEEMYGARYLLSIAILYEVIADDMDLTFEEMQFFWRASILWPITMVDTVFADEW